MELTGVGMAERLAQLTEAGILLPAKRPKRPLREHRPGPRIDVDLTDHLER